MRTLSLVFVGAFLLFGSSLRAESTRTIRWSVAHEPTNTRLLEAAESFGKRLSEQSNGRLKLEIVHYPESVADPFEKARTDLLLGNVEMSQVGVLTLRKDTPALNVLMLPGLFKDHAHVESVVDGQIGRELMAAVLTGSNERIRSMAFTYSGGFRDMFTTHSNLTQAAFAQSRSPLRPREESGLLAQMGAKTVDCPDCHLKKNLAKEIETGELDLDAAHMNRIATIVSYMKPEMKKKITVIESNHSVFLTSIVINEAFYQSLSADLKKILVKNVKEMADEERRISIDQADKNKEFLKSQGVRFVKAEGWMKQAISKISRKYVAQHEKMFPRSAAKVSKLAKKPSSYEANLSK